MNAPTPESHERHEPLVDLIIAVHTAERAIERAVGSVLRGTAAPVRVTVVCHGVDPALIEARLGPLADDPRVRLLPFTDGIPSPAGPFNFGLDSATARFTAVLGSDDELEAGAIDSWLSLQQRDDAQLVVPRVRRAAGGSLRTPPTRPFRSRRLDGTKDRLAYRTAQLGLVDRVRFADARFASGLKSGEDIAYGLRLWFSGARIALDRHGPAYLIHADASDRASMAIRDLTDDFEFLGEAIDATWIATLQSADRQAITMKLLRTHLIDAIRTRFVVGRAPSRPEREVLARVVRRVLTVAPEVVGIVSMLDRRLIEAAIDPGSDASLIVNLLQRRSLLLRPANLLSAKLGYAMHREAPLRFYAAVFVSP